MDLTSFLYRRLSRFVTCCFRMPGGGELRLDNKYQVASFQDVFLDANYWRVFGLFDEMPKLIVDCGAHCGHFSILTDICLRARFGSPITRYILIEPNTALLPSLRRNIALAKLSARSCIIEAAVGKKVGTARFATNEKNFLHSRIDDEGAQLVSYVDVASLINGQQIGLLKLDIEGAEFEFVRENPNVLRQTQIAFVEVHTNIGSLEQFLDLIEPYGLAIRLPVVEAHGNHLILLERPK